MTVIEPLKWGVLFVIYSLFWGFPEFIRIAKISGAGDEN